MNHDPQKINPQIITDARACNRTADGCIPKCQPFHELENNNYYCIHKI